MRPSFFAVLIGLIVSPAALAQNETPAAACALRQPAAPRLMGLGTITGIQTPAVAQADIPRREARLGGVIDPHYLGDLRVVVRQDDGRVQVFDVPPGVSVQVGERATLRGSYRSPLLPCSYIPILVITNVPIS